MAVEKRARCEVQPVVARGGALARLQLAPLVVQLLILLAGEVVDLGLEPAGDAAHHVHQAVDVGGDEVHR